MVEFEKRLIDWKAKQNIWFVYGLQIWFVCGLAIRCYFQPDIHVPKK